MEARVSEESRLGEGSLNNNVLKSNLAKKETGIENDYNILVPNIEGGDEKDIVGNILLPLPSVEISEQTTMILAKETSVIQCDIFTNDETADDNQSEIVLQSDRDNQSEIVLQRDRDVGQNPCATEEVNPDLFREGQKHNLILTPGRGVKDWKNVPLSGLSSSIVQVTPLDSDDALHRYSFNVPPPMFEGESGTFPMRESATSDLFSARDSVRNFAHTDSCHTTCDEIITSEQSNIYCDEENLAVCKEEKSEPKNTHGHQIPAQLAPDPKELSRLEANESFLPANTLEEGSLLSGVTDITSESHKLLTKLMELPPETTQTSNQTEATGEKIRAEHSDTNEGNSDHPSVPEARNDPAITDVSSSSKVEKPRAASLKVKKGKMAKESSKAPIIDEDVLNEVMMMSEKLQSKEKESAESAKTKSKSKKKKAMKTKRSNSKSEGTSPTYLRPEEYPIAQRRKLKRGLIWKKESEVCPSPTSDPGISRPSSGDKNTYQCESLVETNLCLPKSNVKMSCENETAGSSSLTLDAINDDPPTCEYLSTNVDNGLEDAVSVEASFEVKVPSVGTSVGSRDSEDETLASYDEIAKSGDVNEMSCPGDKSSSVQQLPVETPSIKVTEKIVCEDESNDAIKEHTMVTDSGTKLNEEQFPVSDIMGLFQSDKEDSCNDPDVYTFNTTVSVIKPLKPTLEFVSDHSSRSSSMDRETVVANRFYAHEQSSLIETPSLKDVSLCPLFDDIEASKLDGTNKIKMRNKKRHSLPSSRCTRQQILASKSFDSAMSSPSFQNSLEDVNLENLNKSYENAGELLYDEKCSCNSDEPISTELVDERGNTRITSDATFHLEITSANPVESENYPNAKSDSDDSDATDTWHHKNIKEKIKNIIGSRLQPCHDRVIFVGKDDGIRAESPLPRSSSHSASSSKSSSEPREESHSETTAKYGVHDNTEILGSFGAPISLTSHIGSNLGVGTNEFERESEVKYLSQTNDAEGDTAGEKYQNKLNLNLNHLSLTYLTDSEIETQDSEIAPEDAMLMKENQDAGLARIVERWETLQVKAVERQRQSTQLRQLQRHVKNLRLSMERVMSQCSAFAHPHTLDDPSQIGHKVEVAKSLLDETENLRNDLTSLNVMVHRFTSEIGSTFTPLKDEMAELYRLWDETNRRVNAELSRLQSAEATWRLWEEQKTELSQALKQDSDTLKVIDAAIDSGRLTETVTASVHDVAKLLNERRFHPNEMKVRNQTSAGDVPGKELKTRLEFGRKDDRLSDSGTSGYESCSSDDLSERERRLAYLRRLARDLEVSLVPGSKAWNDISSTLAEAEKELKVLQDQCRNLLLRTAETLDPSSKQPRFSSNSRRRNWARENKNCRSPRFERRTKNVAPRREWIWRVVRAALPFQAALLLLLCVACLLEPNCCNSVNTLNSFAPQLRFVQGSLPV